MEQLKLKLQGKLIEKFDTEFFGEKNFAVRKFAIEVKNERNEEWNFPRLFQLTKDKVDMLEAYKEGDEIIVHYNLRGRTWVDMKKKKKDRVNVYFNTDEAWRIEPVNDTAAPEFNAADTPPAPEEDDLPF